MRDMEGKMQNERRLYKYIDSGGTQSEQWRGYRQQRCDAMRCEGWQDDECKDRSFKRRDPETTVFCLRVRYLDLDEQRREQVLRELSIVQREMAVSCSVPQPRHPSQERKTGHDTYRS